ncbi:nitrite reductase small subunit NirD [Paenibacillus sp. GD4]|uniref:nitrite reductase small subunit NirD n=1 Tax=Paenibacillus TaxID=44249 RepID=UPI002543415A|nr:MULTISPECIES: nitrite reductase small subunit NirD [Paenibacillus]MDQ1911663.1 nitrite reductase small subunit NirD [Paenibacillus sp. GD4]
MERIMVGHVSDIPELRSRTVTLDGVEVAVFKLSDGRIRAVENRCPHKGGKLSEGIVCDTHVFCPLHDWKINLKNGLVQAPDEGCVTTYAVEVDEQGYMHLLLKPETKSA